MGKLKGCINECLFDGCKYWHKEKGHCIRYFCFECANMLTTGTPTLRVTYDIIRKNPEGIELKLEGYHLFHPNCYKNHLSNWIDNWFETHHRIKRLRGRPKEYKNGKLMHQLKALRKYHFDIGHIEQVTILDNKIKEFSR